MRSRRFWIGACSLFFVLALAFLAWMRYGVYLPSRHSACFWKQPASPDRPFCDLAVLKNLPVPPALATRFLELVAAGKGSRTDIPGVKAGKTIPSDVLQREIGPALNEFYRTLAARVSAEVGAPVAPAPTATPLSICVLVYEKDGDFITWHYDSNYFRGRFFTLLLPLTTDDTCTKFQYMGPDKRPASIALQPETAILFEGERVWHSASPLCPGQHRAILSFQFSTDPTLHPLKRHVKWVKEWLHS